MAQTGPRDKATIEALKERMARDPLSRAFLQLAEEYRKVGRFEEAVQVCNEGLARHPGYHTARIALGRTYLDAGDLESAHQALIEVLESMPENHLAGKLLAEVQLRLGNRAGAADTYRAILSHYPGDREVEGLLSELGEGGDQAASTPEVSPVQPENRDSTTGEDSSERTSPLTEDAAAASSPPLEMVDGGGAPPGSPSFPAQAASAASIESGMEMPIPENPAEPSDRGPAEERVTAAADPVVDQVPVPPAPVAATPPAEVDALQTNTLAELYLRQGLVEKALDVYRAMLRVDPGNERARQRLRDLSDEEPSTDAIESSPTAPIPTTAAPDPIEPVVLADPAAGAASAEVVPRSSLLVPGGDGGELPAPGTPEVEAGAEQASPGFASQPGARAASAAIDRLERWLVTIRSGSQPAGGEFRR